MKVSSKAALCCAAFAGLVILGIAGALDEDVRCFVCCVMIVVGFIGAIMSIAAYVTLREMGG